MRVVSIYRPPSTPISAFIQESSEFLEDACLEGSSIVIACDLNIHWDKPNASLMKQYMDLLKAFGLSQHTNAPTHKAGHILDHILTHYIDNTEIKNIEVQDFVSDHNLVSCTISMQKRKSIPKEIVYRKINAINIQAFREDIIASNLYTKLTNMTLEELVSNYNLELRAVLNKHAPEIARTKTNRIRDPWFTLELFDRRRQYRKRERKYRKYQQADDKKAFEKLLRLSKTEF